MTLGIHVNNCLNAKLLINCSTMVTTMSKKKNSDTTRVPLLTSRISETLPPTPAKVHSLSPRFSTTASLGLGRGESKDDLSQGGGPFTPTGRRGFSVWGTSELGGVVGKGTGKTGYVRHQGAVLFPLPALLIPAVLFSGESPS